MTDAHDRRRAEEEAAAGDKPATDRALRRQIPPQHFAADTSRSEQGQCHLQRWNPDRNPAEGRGSEAEADPSQRQLTGFRQTQTKENTTDGYFSA